MSWKVIDRGASRGSRLTKITLREMMQDVSISTPDAAAERHVAGEAGRAGGVA